MTGEVIFKMDQRLKRLLCFA